jgi:hypothetical protein
MPLSRVSPAGRLLTIQNSLPSLVTTPVGSFGMAPFEPPNTEVVLFTRLERPSSAMVRGLFCARLEVTKEVPIGMLMPASVM